MSWAWTAWPWPPKRKKERLDTGVKDFFRHNGILILIAAILLALVTAVVSMLLGALLVTVCDLLGRVIFAPFELPVGILLSLLGGPFFLWLLFRQRGGRRL